MQSVSVSSDQLGDLLPRYAVAQRALGRSAESIEKYVAGLTRFFRALGDNATLADVSRQAILDYRDTLAARGRSGSTIINFLACVSSFAEWCIERELLCDNPTVNIRRPRKKEPAPDPLMPEQVTTLLDTIAPPDDLALHAAWHWQRNRRVVLLMLFAGLRKNEVRCLTWQRVLLQDEILDVREGVKGGRPRRVAIHPTLCAELRAVPEYLRQPAHAVVGLPTGALLSRGGIDHVFDRWLARDLDIDQRLGTHLHAHKLRATFATYFAWNGGHTLTLQQLMGHRDSRSTLHYVLTDDEEKRRQMRKLSFTRD